VVEKEYPLRYYGGAYDQELLDGLLKVEKMKKLVGFCRYCSEGPGMAGDWNVEDYPGLSRDHARVCRALLVLAENLGVLNYEE
jgi:hypothetical protein